MYYYKEWPFWQHSLSMEHNLFEFTIWKERKNKTTTFLSLWLIKIIVLFVWTKQHSITYFAKYILNTHRFHLFLSVKFWIEFFLGGRGGEGTLFCSF